MASPASQTLPDSSSGSGDSAVLALLGKKQILKRRFSLVSLFGFAVAELITWETVLALFSQGFTNGGPAGLVYGFIIAWSSTLSVYTVISELASLAPIAGGQYYWVYMLAPPEYKTVFSYVTGWLTSLAWVATVATETLFAGTMLQGILILDYSSSYKPERYQGTLLTWAVIIICVSVNCILPNWLPRFEIFILVFHIAGFIAIVTTLWVMTPNIGSNASVWLTSLNEGGWPTQGLSYCVGFLGNVATFVGADASVHLAEEVSNAAVNIPRAIIGAMTINGAVGFIMMVTTLYCLGDVDKVLGTKIDFPFIQIFKDSVQNTAGATVMAAVVLSLTFACSIGITTTASRMVWSFARDNGLPGSKFLSKVDKRTKIPVHSVLVVTTIAALLTLIYIGSDVAFNDVVSLTITGFYGSYLLPSGLLLYHRIKGHVLPHGSPADETEGTTVAPRENDFKPTASSSSPNNEPLSVPSKVDTDAKMKADTNSPPPRYSHESHEGETAPDISQGTVISNTTLIWGPFHVPGLLGTLNNAYACVYMVFVIFWSVWPPATPVTAENMNYSIVVTGGIMILSTIWYFLRAKKEYRGPLIDREVVEVVRRRSSVA